MNTPYTNNHACVRKILFHTQVKYNSGMLALILPLIKDFLSSTVDFVH